MKPYLSILLIYDQQTDHSKLLEHLLAGAVADSALARVELLVLLDSSRVNTDQIQLWFDERSEEYGSMNIRLFTVDTTQLSSKQLVSKAVADSNGQYVAVLPPGVLFSTPNMLPLAAHAVTMYTQSLVSIPCYRLNGASGIRMEGHNCFLHADFPPFASDGYLRSRGLSCVFFAQPSLWLTLNDADDAGKSCDSSVHQFLLDAYRCLAKMTTEHLILAGEGVFYAPEYLSEEIRDAEVPESLVAASLGRDIAEEGVTLFGNFSSEAMHMLGQSCARADGRDFGR